LPSKPWLDALAEGDDKKMGYFVGQVLKASDGKAESRKVNRLLQNVSTRSQQVIAQPAFPVPSS